MWRSPVGVCLFALQAIQLQPPVCKTGTTSRQLWGSKYYAIQAVYWTTSPGSHASGSPCSCGRVSRWLWAEPTDTILDQSTTQDCKQALMGGVGRATSGQQTSSTTTNMPTKTNIVPTNSAAGGVVCSVQYMDCQPFIIHPSIRALTLAQFEEHTLNEWIMWSCADTAHALLTVRGPS